MEEEMQLELLFHPEVEFSMKVADNDSEKQIAHIQELVEAGIDALIVAPNETEPLTPIVEQVFDAGIPVILLDRKINSNKYTAFIGADNYEIGKIAGEYLATRFLNQGKILELQISMTISPAIDRSQGFKDALAEHPNLSVVEVLPTEGTTAMIQEQLPVLMQQNPDINIIFGHTDFVVQTAAQTLNKNLKDRDVFYIGVDGLPGNNGGMQAVKDELIDATLLYPTGGTEAIQLALDIVNNQSYDKKNTLQTTVIDERNVRIMKLQTNKILNQQKNIERQRVTLSEQRSMYQSQRIVLYAVLALIVLLLVLGGLLLKTLQSRNEALRTLKQKKQEIEKQRNEILAFSEKAKMATQSKLQFFTNISHEFRTPLTLILGTIDSLATSIGAKSKQLQTDLVLMRKNALRLLRLINQLMDIQKVENNRMQVQATENNLVVFVKEIMNAYQKVADKRKIDFRIYFKEETLSVWFDQNMMDKVLFNLLSNAFKFTPDGGNIHITIDQNILDNQAVIVVEDNGHGMSSEESARAFERFYQGSATSFKGTGLGLSLSKELVEFHHGRISLQSREGRGTRFKIELPLGSDHFSEDQIAEHSSDRFALEDETYITFPVISQENLKPEAKPEVSLLFIEDNEDLQYFLSSKLSGLFNIHIASNGDEGWAKALEIIPDIILCDISLPGRNGLTLTREFKSDLRTSHIPIILLTARSSAEQKIEGVKTGADIYLTKPFNLTYLIENIKSLLNNRALLKRRYSTERVLQEKNISEISKVDGQFLQQFVSFIKDNFHNQELGLPQLQKEFGLSRTQLYRKVKALMGQSVSDYIQEVRLEKAKHLLSDGNMTIAEIAYEVGYTSPSYFSTAFKAKFDISPSEYRGK